MTEVESALEREISWSVLRDDGKLPRRKVDVGDTLVEQGQPGRDMFLVLDGALDVEVDGEAVAQLGPGTVVGEGATLAEGKRTATLRAVTPCRVAVLSADRFTEEALAELASGRGREKAS